jgi:prepilin-type processing-associated H-X9-DG protein
MELNPPHNPNTPELINGAAPYTTHYYGVIGPKGINVATNQNYLVDGPATHGNYSRQGMFHWTNRPFTHPNATPADKQLTQTRSRAFHDVLDGTSNTFMVGELSWWNNVTGTRYRSWMRGYSSEALSGCKNVVNSINTPSIALFNDIAFGSMHPKGANFAFCDGAVKFVSQNISLSIYRSTASRNGGESFAINSTGG